MSFYEIFIGVLSIIIGYFLGTILPAYFFGRLLKLRPRSTPLGMAGKNLKAEEALRISAIANKVRGSGSGRTAWDMGETFHTEPHKVTWEMLEKVRHTPIVIVRRISTHH